MIWQLKERELNLSQRGMIMGILNATPDSFSDGGSYFDVGKAIDRALEMEQQGAEIIDIGGESTRPGALKVPVEQEVERTIPVIEALRKESDVIISIDTSKARVAKLALEAGADIVNDVTGLTGDPEMPAVCKKYQCGVVIMHMQGNPQTMQDAPSYSSVTDEVKDYFEERYKTLTDFGISSKNLCFDPGIGFGKTLNHNKQLIRELASLRIHNRPLLLGVSRKSMIGSILKEDDPKQRDWGTVALTSLGRKLGAEIHRVHEVKKNTDALRMMEAMMHV